MPLFITCNIAAIENRNRSVTIPRLFVGPHWIYTCIPAKTLRALGVKVRKKVVLQTRRDQEPIVRALGYVILRAHGFETVDEVVFGESDDVPMLGSRTLAGFRATAERGKKRLIPSGPVSAPSNRAEDWR